MDENFSNPPIIDARKYAVIVWALALTRGLLYSVVQGEFEVEEIRRVLDATSLRALAPRIGCKESELALDWSEHLSSSEQDIYSQSP